jgi:hypothetical protein
MTSSFDRRFESSLYCGIGEIATPRRRVTAVSLWECRFSVSVVSSVLDRQASVLVGCLLRTTQSAIFSDFIARAWTP